MSMPRALELLEYYNEHPPAHIAIALAFLERKKSSPRIAKPLDESMAISQMQQLSGELGQSAERVPDHLRELADWASSQKARFRKS